MKKMKTKQTTIQWLISQLNESRVYPQLSSVDAIFEYALKEEREQIETAFEEGMFHHVNGLTPKEYYEERFIVIKPKQK